MLAKWGRDKKSIGEVNGGWCQASLSSGHVFKFLYFSSLEPLLESGGDGDLSNVYNC